jgi:hypothetical protein
MFNEANTVWHFFRKGTAYNMNFQHTQPFVFRFALAVIGLVVTLLSAQAQSYSRMDLEVTYGQQPLDTDQPYFLLQSGDTLEITLLRWYFQGKRPQARNEVIFVDYLNQQSFTVPSDVQEWQLGLDSALHVTSVKAGPLDPINAMHWNNHKGFIHFRLEGMIHRRDHTTTDVLLCIGGFMAPFNTVHRLPFTKKSSGTFTYSLDIEPLMSYCQESITWQILRPCEEGTVLSRLIAQNFKLLP